MGKLDMFSTMGHRNFRWLWFGNLAFGAAQGMQFLVLSWLVFESLDLKDSLKDSASQVGLVIFFYGLPNLAFLIFGGTIADRIDRRVLLIVTQGMVVLLTVIVATGIIFEQVRLWHVCIMTLVLGMVEGLTWPARTAIVADLVHRDHLMNAVAWNSTGVNAGQIVGAVAAGWIIEAAGVGPAMVFNSSCYLVGLLCLIPIRLLGASKVAAKASVTGDFLRALTFVWKMPVALTLVVMGATFGLFAFAYDELVPAFARQVLAVDATGAGQLRASRGIGALVGSIALACLGNFKHKNWLLLLTAAIFGISLFLFAWSRSFWVSWILLLFAGLGSVTFISVGTAILQLTVPAQMHGRVLSLWAIGGALHFIGALPMAAVADRLSWPISIAGGSALFLIVLLWIGIWRPTLRRLKV